MRTESNYGSIEADKLAAVQAIVLAQRPEATEDQVEGFVLADWPNNEEHQEWLDCAEAVEIAAWVLDSTAHGELYTLLDED